ncbi:MAG TPA: response regulator transcription factor [Polyangiaceae bacterium]|nr:response regulator transcription factor [Polyangiaceae bacterium]
MMSLLDKLQRRPIPPADWAGRTYLFGQVVIVALYNSSVELKFDRMLALTFAAAIIAESALVRSGLAAILGASPEIRVVAEATPAEASSLPTEGVDVVVCDIADGARAEAIMEQAPRGVPVLALVGRPEATRALVRAGVKGVIARDASSERLSAASVAVATGLCTLDEQTLQQLVSPTPAGQPQTLLTPREQEVLELLAEGLSNKLIGLRLDISEHTAKFHVNSILEKLEADTRTDAVVRAARRGMLTL